MSEGSSHDTAAEGSYRIMRAGFLGMSLAFLVFASWHRDLQGAWIAVGFAALMWLSWAALFVDNRRLQRRPDGDV